MRSKANLKSHPIHPMLIPFPLAFFTSALVFDLLGFITGNQALATTAAYLGIAGVVGGLAAAVPGLIDYAHTIPKNSSAKKRAARHGLLNSLAVLIFIGLIFYRDAISPVLVLTLEAIAMVLLSLAGWLGGTLVYRNQIGVDIRYANAGKWKEIHVPDFSHPVASKDELTLNQMKLVHVGKERVVLAATEQGFAAFSDYCTHHGASLAAGALMCGTVQCPWHGSQFKVDTGDIVAGPARKKIKTYKVALKDGMLYIEKTNQS